MPTPSRSACGARRGPEEVPTGTWDIDLFIASAEHRGRGLGAAALALLAEEVFATTLAVACCAFVSVRNEAAVRAYERTGFRWRRIWQRPAARALLADAEGAADASAARSLSCPAATSRRDTVHVLSPAISSSVALTRPSLSPWPASQASTPPASAAQRLRA